MMSYGKSQFNVLQSILIACILFSALQLNAQTIVHPSDASIAEQQAAKELRRYIFLRTGTAPTLAIADNYSSLPAGDVIVVSANARAIITELKQEYGNVNAPDSDNRKGYLIKSISKDGRNVLVITGADTTTTLNAAYRFAELIGCHFNLAGDVIPDQKLSYPLTISGYDEKSQPWFELRGCLPFHNFLAGPDFWSTADYKSFIGQQAKMGFNFFGLHYYSEFGERGPGEDGQLEGPESHLWIGHKTDVNADGTIKEAGAYKSYWASTYRTEKNCWNGMPLKTTDFTNGADKLFAYDYMASDAIGSKEPTTPAEKAANFNNVGLLLKDAFSHAKQLGVKTALGSTAPMGFMPGKADHVVPFGRIHSCPVDVQSRMRDTYGYTLPTSRGYANEVFTKGLYEGVFTRIARTHPLDYYWLWTFECMTYGGDPILASTVDAIADDYRYCSEVRTAMETPFKMATFGWKVGSAGFRSSLEFLDVPFGTLWDNAEGIKTVIGAGREGWSSCWYEEDWGLIQPQLRVTGIWNEVGHGLRAGGVQALIAKHWRINSIAPMSSAHAQLAWDNRGLVADSLPGIKDGGSTYTYNTIFDDNPFRGMESHDSTFIKWITKFYQDWAKANFGPERSDEIGTLLAKADRFGEPKPVRRRVLGNDTLPIFKGGIPRTFRFIPSALYELDPEEGDPTAPTQDFRDAFDVYYQFCSYKDDIVGAGNKDRYMYWYHFFKGQIELGKLTQHNYNYSVAPTAALKDSIKKTWAKVMKHEISRVRNVSELGVIAQLQQSTWHETFRLAYEITDHDTIYEGEKAVRAMPEITQIYENDSLEQKVIFLGNGTISSPTMYYREMGSTGAFSTIALTTIGSSANVMKATLANPGYDFEYYIQGSVGGQMVTYPVTGGNGTGNINKTVVSVKKVDFVGKELKPLPVSGTLSEVVVGAE